MKSIARLFCIGALLTLVVGCAQVQKVFDLATSASVSPTAVIVSVNSFDILEVSAAKYIGLPRCSTTASVVCSDVEAVQVIKKTVRDGRDARNKLEAFMKAHPGELGPSGLYDALNGAVDELKKLFFKYNVATS